jgi:MurNAc alpha-1-phosphate uridylyltransferase
MSFGVNTIPQTAMVLAAGLGTRMRPLTNDRPKALVEVDGRTLIDHNLDRLRDAGVKRAIVNVHAFADLLEAHVKRRTDLEIVISDERATLMETGGGFKQARALLGDAPVFVCNIDSVWEEPQGSALKRLAQGFDPKRMGARLMLTPMDQCLGYEGAGDFSMSGEGEIGFRGDAPSAPFAYMGAQIVDPAIIDAEPLEPFSFTRVWRRLAGEGRLHGALLGGYWMHVGDPDSKLEAEARLSRAAALA